MCTGYLLSIDPEHKGLALYARKQREAWPMWDQDDCVCICVCMTRQEKGLEHRRPWPLIGTHEASSAG